MTTPDDAEPGVPPSSRLWWAVPLAASALLVVLGLVLGGRADPLNPGTSYDASDKGFRAAYLLLEELGFPVGRSRQAAGGEVRWVLLPVGARPRDVEGLDGWVRRGGLVLLAVEDAAMAEPLGLRLAARPAPGGVEPAEGADVGSLDVGATRVEADAPGGDPWAGVRAGGGPVVTVYPRGRGEVWLLHRPEVFRNRNLRHPGNAVLACRLAGAMLERRPGRLAFDEYFHGLRERPGVAELLLRPPMLGVTLQGLAAAALALWRFAPRFGPLRPLPPKARRSQEEFLDAVAGLLERKGDHAEAYRTLRDDALRRMAAELGLPADSPPGEVVREAGRRRGLPAQPLLGLLTADGPPPPGGPAAFLDSLHQLETATHDFFRRRRSPR